ncbi:Glutamyl-tRNA(Gln) amidotransferase subunit A [bacterium HR11]|nr:Glutamyl-tRNA(Gln) amidotransferase subunit A [bacterium HR11]
MKIPTEWWTWTVDDFQSAYRRGTLHPQEVVRAFAERTEALDPQVRAFLHWDAETVRDAVRRLPRPSDGWPLLYGIPVAIKDNICTEGYPTTCASRILEGFIAPYDATAVARLKAAGYSYFGKTNMDEFAMGSSTENSGYFPTRNPWDLTRVPGGSSGGSAAAVAAGMVPAALGSDTGGSVRQPAALCGVVGMKPTYGRVSRYGLVAFASSLDVIGVITRRVWDNAVVLHVIAGYDEMDQTTADVPVFSLDAVRRWESHRRWRLGLPREAFAEGLDEDTRTAIRTLVEELAREGCEVLEISLPHSPYAIATYYVICTSEASSNLARYDGVRYGRRAAARTFREMYARTRADGFGPEVKRRIMLGTFALSAGYYDAYYLTAARARTLIAQDFARAFETVDLVLTPTSPSTAWRLGEKLDDPLKMYLSDIYTVPASLAGLPAISVPIGKDRQGLPIGLQVIGPHFQEERLYQFAMWVEQLRPFYREVPPGVDA